MLLNHCTPRRNLPGCCASGLLTSKSRGRLPAVWLCAPSRAAWALIHVAKRHKARVEHVVTLEIDVPRSWLRRSRRGVWYCPQDIPPERFGRLYTWGAVAGAITNT